jgi:hypothetical protein
MNTIQGYTSARNQSIRTGIIMVLVASIFYLFANSEPVVGTEFQIKAINWSCYALAIISIIPFSGALTIQLRFINKR